MGELMVEEINGVDETVKPASCSQCGYFSYVRDNEDEIPKEVAKPAEPTKETRPMRNGRPIGRNSECPCGSGKKYKRCCESGA